jgi:predicted metalloprotease
MRWREGRESENVEDRRGESAGGGGGFGFPMGGGGMRLGGGTILLIVLGAWLFGANPLTVLQMLAGGGSQTMQVDTGDTGNGGTAPAPAPPADDEGAKFVSVVLADTEDVWTQIFSAAGQRYEDPKLVLFTDTIRSACGMAQSAMGPFYCPNDHKVYIDLAFYRELRDRFQAPGEFAQAYVVAHEVGHHVQTLLGTSQKVHEAQERSRSQEQANALSVRLELQADCYAGVWANHANQARHILEQGDVEAGLNAAAAIGDDRIQRQTQGTVVPESFTHGSSAQRVGWFKRGLEQGDPDQCDTFASGNP